MIYLRVFIRGFILVALVAANLLERARALGDLFAGQAALGSGEVRPGAAKEQTHDGMPIDAVDVSELLLCETTGAVVAPNTGNSKLGELRLTVSRSASLSLFADLVGNVFFVRTEKQMIRPDTGRRIAAVADL